MNFTTLLVQLSRALGESDGNTVAYLLSAFGEAAAELLKDTRETSRLSLLKHKNSIASPWDEVCIAHAQVALRIREEKWVDAYTEQANMVKAFERAFINLQAWILPALFTILQDLRTLAEKADDSRFQEGNTASGSLEDAARLCNRAFTDCVMDRVTGPDSRKWGTYRVVGFIFKCYFSVNKIALSRNIIRALQANKDIPPLEQFPRADQVTYLYYLGMLGFLNETYSEADTHLSKAFDLCYGPSTRNQELILNYLVPLRLIRGQLPSSRLLQLFPRLEELYTPFIRALKAGDIKGYDAALEWAEVRLVEMGVYLAVEKAREICLRSLFRKVWVIMGKPSRIQLPQFHEAFRISGLDQPIEETECLLANMIFKGYVKGYISHEKQTVVLAKGAAAFPPVGR